MFSYRLLLSIFCVFSFLLLNLPFAVTRIPTDSDVPFVINLSQKEYQENLTKFTCSIFYNNQAAGSGIVISKHFVLTTCQCLYKRSKTPSPAETEVGWGEFRETLQAIAVLYSQVTNIYTNPECFKTSTLFDPTGDIAVLKTDLGIMEGMSLEYAHLPLRNTRHAWCQELKHRMFLSNFRINHDIATSLDESIWIIKTSIVQPKICSRLLGEDRFHSKDNFCASYYHIGNSNAACEEDYGSVLTRGRYVCGLLSYKIGCGAPQSVASFVSIARHVSWIRNTVRESSNGKEVV